MGDPVQEYFDVIQPSRKEKLMMLHELILECFPDASVDMQYKMPTYKYAEGWVAIANQKNYVSLYTCGAAHLVKFRESHPEIKTGKGCINFRDRDELPMDSLRHVITHAMLHPKG